MKKRTAAVTGAICAVLLTGCASHPDPIIDMQGVDQAALEIDWADCEAYAEEVIVAKGGAGYGAVWGATRSSIDGAREKEMVFKRCMRGRGYRVLN